METTLFYLIAGGVFLFSFLVRRHLMATYQHWSQIRSATGKPGGAAEGSEEAILRERYPSMFND